MLHRIRIATERGCASLATCGNTGAQTQGANPRFLCRCKNAGAGIVLLGLHFSGDLLVVTTAFWLFVAKT